jgi:predicted flavoprotein YhiN
LGCYIAAMKNYDVIILGGGAAGLMCAMVAGRRGRRVLVLERANKVGKKILMSGGGRCNFTNLGCEPARFISANPDFCISALSRYTQTDFIALVEQHGIAYHEKAHGALFCDDSSKDTSESLVIATGGLSIPKMGASDFGYRLARQFGLEVLPTRAGLVPLTVSGALHELSTRLSGLSLRAGVSTASGEVTFTEGILFTHRGLSGPAILQLSSYWRPGEDIRVNLLPDNDAAELLLQAKSAQPKALLRTVLSTVLPRALVLELQALWWPADVDKVLAEISDQVLRSVAGHLNDWTMKPAATEGYRTAEVTLGGIDTHELSSRTMESKSQPGLYCIGEVVDVTGHLGGFNFQWAWSSGQAAGEFV